VNWPEVSAADYPALRDPIERLEFPCHLGARIRNALLAEGIVCLGDLIQCSESEIMRLPNLSRKSTAAIKEALARHGLHLPTRVSHMNPPEAA